MIFIQIYFVFAFIYGKAYYENKIVFFDNYKEYFELFTNSVLWPFSIFYFIFKKELE